MRRFLAIFSFVVVCFLVYSQVIECVERPTAMAAERVWPPEFVAIAGGGTHSAALDSDGNLWTWGYNFFGQVGTGKIGEFYVKFPCRVKYLTDVVAIATGGNHTLALKEDGTVWEWGCDYLGQTSGEPIPEQVLGLPPIAAIAAGDSHSLALAKNGIIWSWGSNNHGQLGDATQLDRPVPIQVVGISNVIAIAAGAYHSSALRVDGTVWCWGDNSGGQLGLGTFTTRTIPVQVPALNRVKAIGAGIFHTVALRENGTVWAWGSNAWFQLGNSTSPLPQNTPGRVEDLTKITAIAVGGFHNLALTSDGTVWGWGNNQIGQLGDGTVHNRIFPAQVPNLWKVAKIAAGGSHSLALLRDGTLLAWGDNYSGQLGDGTLAAKYFPSVVAFFRQNF